MTAVRNSVRRACSMQRVVVCNHPVRATLQKRISTSFWSISTELDVLRSYFSRTRTFLRSFFAKFLGTDYSKDVATQSRRKGSAPTSERTQSINVINVRRLITYRIIIDV